MTSNSDIAQKFANGSKKGKSLNMFIEDDTIYSYGYHFPIAKRYLEKFFLFTLSEYSISTAKHKSEVFYAIDNTQRTIIKINGADEKNAKATIKQQKQEIKEHEKKLKNARVQTSKDHYKRDIKDLKYNIQLIENVLSEFLKE